MQNLDLGGIELRFVRWRHLLRFDLAIQLRLARFTRHDDAARDELFAVDNEAEATLGGAALAMTGVTMFGQNRLRPPSQRSIVSTAWDSETEQHAGQKQAGSARHDRASDGLRPSSPESLYHDGIGKVCQVPT